MKLLERVRAGQRIEAERQLQKNIIRAYADTLTLRVAIRRSTDGGLLIHRAIEAGR